ncbi:MAG: hypothetical protein B7Z37_16410 [Verrucomicrobia bacterium 12-59-8]|nr:MAG: hypothetical protein B7Z37_16410 [Verrucomicrobia bacterium 12-59-8]
MLSWLTHRDNRTRLFRWSAILGGFAVVQLLVQALNALAGFLLVRTMEKPDYAWFTIANGMSATLSVLSDLGVGSAVTSIGGAVWQDKASLKGLVQAALRLRLKLAILSSVVVTGISFWLLLRNGTGLACALGLTALIVAPIWQISTTAVLNVVNRLHSRTRQLQVADLVPALVRTGLTVLLINLGIITTFSALLAVLIAQFIQFVIVKRQVLPLLGLDVEPHDVQEHTANLWKLVRQMMPNCVFLCIQGQLTTWLISIFASTSEVADLGALNRVGIVFAVFAGPVVQFVAPTFARAQNLKRLVVIAVALFWSFLCGTLILVLAAWFKGDWFLWLLGANYGHLHQELILILIGMALGSLTNMTWALNISRGWVNLSWLYIPLTIAAQIVSVSLFQLNTVIGLALFGITSAGVQSLHAGIVCLLGLLRWKPAKS